MLFYVKRVETIDGTSDQFIASWYGVEFRHECVVQHAV